MSDYFNCPVITVSREYGAGGRSFASGLSKKLGLQWFDHDFIKETARDSGYSIQRIKDSSEEMGLLDYIMNNTVVFNSEHDKIFEAQKQEVLKLSDHPCIIMGRTANFILREAGVKTFDVFLYGSLESRMERIKEIGANKNIDLKKFVERRDALRKNYYKHYTKRNLGDYRDYSICLDSGVIGIEGCIDIVSTIINNIKKSS